MKLRTKLALMAIPSVAMATAARAEDPATALAAIQTLSGQAAGYAPVMFGLAVAVIGIMIGIKWIKRAKGAA